MNPEMWQRVKKILHSALDHDRERWPAYLAETCGHDVDLFLEVSSLLAASRGAEGFIERPALELLGLGGRLRKR
jgi:hypothetical protein